MSTTAVQQKLEVKPIDTAIYDDLVESMKAAYPQWTAGFWSREAIHRLIRLFPEGQFGVFMDGRIVGCALSIIVDYDKFGNDHDYRTITGNYSFSTHDAKHGTVLYGIEVFIHPDFRGLRLGRRLYDARKDLCERLNLRSVMFGGRMPLFHKYAHELSPAEYIQKVKYREIHDPVLSFQLANDFHVVKLLRNYMPHDEESLDNATLLEWDNIHHEEKQVRSAKARNVRLGMVQWQMRPIAGIEDLFKQIDFFLEAVSGYQSDFALLPELFNAPLMAAFNHMTEAKAMRKLAQFTEPIRDHVVKSAMRFNVNVICGSMPFVRGRSLYNIGFLCRRDGTWEQYDKLHITPNELKYWGMRGGKGLRVFDTDRGRIGILICYDVEFPELSRLLADQGMEILFVPFLTDTQNAYSRVRHCAQARAIENECFVAIAGSVGNLPNVSNMDIQFAQSMVFTPCDFPFPTTGIKGEATPNTEMVLIVDVDLSLLKDLHEYGSVRILKDRRADLYSLRLRGQS
jgi:predicted amidohydrolase/GNAT superfamily N-acetyltransferase